jgi:cell wall-associated NlpC family hydrolase
MMPDKTLTNSALNNSTRWARSMMLAGACALTALLVGCAGIGHQEGSGLNSSAVDWKNSSDPIGSFLARSKNGAGLLVGDVNHPLARQALTQLGIRYRWGGKSPETGFDCSGLVLHSAQQSLGLKLPPRSYDIALFGSDVPRTDLQVGDLVFFNTLGRRNSHVGVYLGDDQFVHSPAAGGVVRIEDMKQAYWSKRFNGARRL